jgi:hypothetical protein
LLVLGGCTADPTDTEGSSATTEQDGEPDGSQVGAAGSEQADEVLEPEAAEPQGRLELTGWEQTHPGGLSVALRAIEVDAAGDLLLDIEAVSTQMDVQLNGFTTFLIDDRTDQEQLVFGDWYELVPPDDDPRLRLAVDERLTGTLVFAGPVDPQARRVTLAINSDTQTIYEVDDGLVPRVLNPSFAFWDIPLPGVGLDAEAAAEQARDTITEVSELDLDVTEEHRSGVTVTLTEVRFDGRNLFLDLEAVNPTSRDQRLTWEPPRLIDAGGARAVFVRVESQEEEDRFLEIPAGGEADATLAFRAPFEPGGTMSLELNWPSAQDLEGGRRPYLLFEELPVPGFGDDEVEQDS